MIATGTQGLLLLATMSAWFQATGAPRTALETKASGAQVFYVDSRVGNNQVTFFSESTLEDFTGVCNQVGGACELDPKRLETFSGRFWIRVGDMRTGIELRDEHLRSADWLDAEQHPRISIVIQSAKDVRKTAPTAAAMTLVGECEVHGVKKPIEIPATLQYLDQSAKTMRRVKGDLIRVRAKFGIKLSDFNIAGPKGSDIIGLKVADDIDLKVTIFGSTERPPEPIDLHGEQPDRAPAKRTPPRRPPPDRGDAESPGP